MLDKWCPRVDANYVTCGSIVSLLPALSIQRDGISGNLFSSALIEL